MKPTILTAGEALTDIVIRTDSPTLEYPGGSPMNVAVALGRLGNNSYLLTHLGADQRGEEILNHVNASHVQLTAGSIQPASETSTAQASIGADGSASYEFNITWAPHPAELPQQVQAMHFSSIAATLLPGADTVREVAAKFREAALISYDPNARPTLMGDPESTREIVEQNIQLADLVKASDEDIAWLYPGLELAAVAQRWLELGVKLAVVTKGGSGASAWTVQQEVSVPQVSVAVADTVGAGDTFSAGLLDALGRLELLGAENREKLSTLSREQLESILHHAALLASVTVSRAGANPPWIQEVEEKLSL